MKRKQRADAILASGAETFKQRNAVYGDSYLTFGKAMSGMLPKGLTIKPGDVAGFQRLGAFMQIVNKCCRYATPLRTGGGHQDSAHDMMLYAALLEEVTVNDPA